MRRRNFWFTILTLIALFSAGLLVAQQPQQVPAAATLALNQKIPVEPSGSVGTLPNGLRYYIRPNKQPGNRAELRLVIKAGSVLEDDDLVGIAQPIELM